MRCQYVLLVKIYNCVNPVEKTRNSVQYGRKRYKKIIFFHGESVVAIYGGISLKGVGGVR